MPDFNPETLHQLDDEQLSSFVARGARILYERSVGLDPIAAAADQGQELINPLRSPGELQPSILGDGRVIVDHQAPDSVIVDGRVRALTPLAFKVLSVLSANRGRIVDFDFTIAAVWPDFGTKDRKAYRHQGINPSTKISAPLGQINRALGKRDLGHPSRGIVQTFRGKGHLALVTRQHIGLSANS